MKHSLLRTVSLALLAAILTCSDGFAALIVSIDETAPSDQDALIRIPVTDATRGDESARMIYWSYMATSRRRHREIGQSFLIPQGGDAIITAFVLRIASATVPVGQNLDFTVSIFKADPRSSNFLPMGTALYTSVGSMPAELTTATAPLQYLTMTLDTPFVAEAGVHYAFQIGFNQQNGAQFDFVTGANSLYSDGIGFNYWDNTVGSPAMVYTRRSTGAPGPHLDFAVIATTIPEARTTTLLVGGLLVAGAFALHQRRRTA